jgi:hypothetical protein
VLIIIAAKAPITYFSLFRSGNFHVPYLCDLCYVATSFKLVRVCGSRALPARARLELDVYHRLRTACPATTIIPIMVSPIDPTEIPLPAFLDTILDYLYDVLPPTWYEFLINTGATVLAISTTLYNLIQQLVASRPWEWDTQTVLPPLIMILTVILIFYTIYRAVLYVIRSTIFFIKWGLILGAIVAGTGYLMANSGTALGNADIATNGMPSIAGALFGMLNSQRRPSDHAANGKGKGEAGGQRPGAWESFESHREWQYEEGNGAAGRATEEAQRLMDGVVNTIRNGGVFGVAQGVMSNLRAFVPQSGDGERPSRPRRRPRDGEAANE